MRLGALDATVHTVTAGKFNIRGFPTIKFFGAGEKTVNDAAEYDGGRTTYVDLNISEFPYKLLFFRSDIVTWANAKAAENLPPPELKQAISQETFEEYCKDKQLCIVSVLPHILDCQSKCRKDYLKTLQSMADKFKKNIWG